MTAVAKGPETHLVYFVVFWLCRELVGAAEDRLPLWTGDGSHVCCKGGPSTLCPSNPRKCGPGESYSSPQCDKCRTLPNCKEGEEIQCSGTIDYNFSCKECSDGTYLDGKTGCCIPWTDCNRNGLQTVQQGNRTHNVRCGIVFSPPKSDSMFTSVLAIVTAAGIFLVILMMFSLLLCMWVQKKENLPETEDLEAIDASNPLQLPQQQEESFSCQYPEEERGHKMAEERDSMLFLAQ